MKKYYFKLFCIALIVVLFFVSLFVSRVPDGTLIPLFSHRMLYVTLIGFLSYVIFLFVTGIISVWLRDDYLKNIMIVAEPFYILGFYPFLVFVLHPIGVPISFSTLIHPRLLIALAVCLALYRITTIVMSRVKNNIDTFRIVFFRHDFLAFLLFIVFITFYGVMVFKEDRVRMLVGDEPHYMLMMES
jgi:hypothetical protein